MHSKGSILRFTESLDAMHEAEKTLTKETLKEGKGKDLFMPSRTSSKKKAKPATEYSTYRATLRLNGKFFAVVSPDVRNSLSEEDAKKLLSALNR